eukprot:15368300-Alexandrium_andersonii.AAC.1
MGARNRDSTVPGECDRRAHGREGEEGGQPHAGIGPELHGALRGDRRGPGDPQCRRGHQTRAQ